VTASVQRNMRTRIGDYLVPAVGIIPAVITPGPGTVAGIEPRIVMYGDVYRQDLLRDVDSQLQQISDVLKGLREASLEAVWDRSFTEAPDHPSYQDAYTWDPIEMPELVAPPRNAAPSDADQVWR
jgi:hypothetical protein